MLEKLVERTTFKDAFIIIVATIALVAFWRGVWGMLDYYFLPLTPFWSFSFSIIVGVLILLVIAWYKGSNVKKVEKEIVKVERDVEKVEKEMGL